MAHIDLIDRENAQRDLAQFYDHVEKAFGMVPPPLLAYGHNPPTAKAIFDGFTAGMAVEGLTPAFLAWVRYMVADHTDCEHCVDVNGGMLMEEGVTPDQLAQARRDPAAVPLDEKEKVLLLACLDMINGDGKLGKGRIDALKAAGLSSAEIVAGLHHAAHSQGVDRLINALGI